MKFCPICNNIIQPDDMFCSKCGTSVKSVEEKPVCPICFHEGKIGDVFCRKCGSSLKENNKEKQMVAPAYVNPVAALPVAPSYEQSASTVVPDHETIMTYPETVDEIQASDFQEPIAAMPTVEKEEEDITYEIRPMFVFVYELLPHSFQTVWLLLILFAASYIATQYYHYSTKLIVVLFAILFILKDLKILYRKFKYRNVRYILDNTGIEYIDDSYKDRHFKLKYENIKEVLIQRNLATYLFGYGHILVKSGTTGIYLDYVAEVDKVYAYILKHTNLNQE